MFMTSVQTVAVVAVMVAIGAFLRRLGILNDESGNTLRKIITKVGTPALTVYNLLGAFPRELLKSAGKMVWILLLIMLLVYAVAWPIARRLKLGRGRASVFRCMCALSNGIFMGLPICQGIFGDAAVPVVMVFFFANTMIFWVIGVTFMYTDVMEGAKGRQWLKMALSSLWRPTQVTFAVSMALLLLDVRLPEFVLATAKQLGNIASPLALIFCGIVLYDNGIGGLKPEKSTWIMLVFRHVVSPAVTLYLCVWLGVDAFSSQVLAVLAGMPCMMLTVIMASEAGADTQYAAKGVSISTLCSLALIPLYAYIAPLLISAMGA